MEKEIEEKILHISFNQDGSCFCLGTNKGFIVYNTSTLKKIIQREFNEGIKIVEMLKRTNIIAFVGNGDIDSDLSVNKLIIWDDHQIKKISELKFSSEILNIKIKIDKIIATTLDNNLYVIELSKLDIINIFQIYQNSKGLFALSSHDEILVLAFPYIHKGYVKIKNYNNNKIVPNINAHDNEISFLTLSTEGNLLATSSERGTLIRIFSTFNGELIQELRRGAKSAVIHCIKFDLKNKFLACSSDSGTVHIFSVYNSIKYLKEKGIIKEEIKNENKGNKEEKKIIPPKNQKSSIGSIINAFKIGISYFESEWSFAQFRLPKSENEKTVICFNKYDNSNSINVVTKSGNLYKAKFDPSLGGECHKIKEINLFQENSENN
mgnify:FL=1